MGRVRPRGRRSVLECQGGRPGPKPAGAAGPSLAEQAGLGPAVPRHVDSEEEAGEQVGQSRKAGGRFGWIDLIRNWAHVEADLEQQYGLRLWHPKDYQKISWHYLRSRVEELLSIPPAILYRPTKQGGHRLVMVPATRIGLVLDPPNLGDDDERGQQQRGT